MKFREIFLSVFTFCFICANGADFRYVGGDISLLPKYEEAGSQYKDENGKGIDLLPFLYESGMNAMRVRLFVDPDAYPGKQEDPYNNACQSLPYIIPLCHKIIEQGFDLMLDFHYSDSWADPAKQWTPESWKNLSDQELFEMIYDYTKSTLQTLKEQGIVPAFIQPGNEISYGMLWGPYGGDIPTNHVYTNSSEASWQRFGDLLHSAIKACREVCPTSQIIIHTERVAQVNVLSNFYQRMKELNIDYDIIGLSYYPYFHGKMGQLDSALSTLEKEFPEKPIMIVETGFPYAWEVPGTDQKVDYDYTTEGQEKFAKELVETLLSHPNVNGLFWWWLEYNAFGSNLKEDWYNAPLFDSRTGKVTPALKTICSFGTGHAGISQTINEEIRNEKWYELNGREINYPSKKGFYIHNNKTVIIP